MDRRRDGSFMQKPQEGWLHDQNALAVGEGIFYSFPLRYLGSVEVRQSMRSLSVRDQTSVCRDLIGLLVEANHLRDPLRQETGPHLSHYLDGKLTPANVDCNLNISVDGMMIVPVKILDNGDVQELGVLENSKMKFISLAAGGEGADYDMVCYIAKDERNHRECFVFDCGEFSDEVLTTIGQAFVLAQDAKSRPKPPPIYDTVSGGDFDHPSFQRPGGAQYSDLPNVPIGGVDNPLYGKEDGAARSHAPPGYDRAAPRQSDGYNDVYGDAGIPPAEHLYGDNAEYFDAAPEDQAGYMELAAKQDGDQGYFPVAPSGSKGRPVGLQQFRCNEAATGSSLMLASTPFLLRDFHRVATFEHVQPGGFQLLSRFCARPTLPVFLAGLRQRTRDPGSRL
eukprot:TRINITY_DN9757_c0_g1_i2.p1 TRINITY_DN9757_c0_g1~~TRINITY_DN9757_c0_g1_i2.p1  ORF type:complete len:414 (+),score=88.59 TRINITY_DN9757_c0_g1_i2:63-1244(+)